MVGFMESIAVAKIYARRHRYDIDPNKELIGLGASNVAAGLFGGYPVTGGFSRTAVNESAGARTPLASIITALIVFARMSKPHAAVLGRIPGTTTFRNIARFPEAERFDGIRVVRIDAALSFVNATNVKRLLLAHADVIDAAEVAPHSLVLEASGINDLDATGAEMLDEVVEELRGCPVSLYW
jgi:MFS superfamily sulfate permease-like transporter